MTASFRLAYHRVDAPRPAAGESKIQECKTKADREIAFTENRKEAARKMFDEIGRSHFAGQDKSHRSREQAKDQEHAADQLEHPGDAKERKPLQILEHLNGWPTEEFCSYVLTQDQAVENPQDTDDTRLPNCTGFHSAITDQNARQMLCCEQRAARLRRRPRAHSNVPAFGPPSNDHLPLISASALHCPPPAKVK